MSRPHIGQYAPLPRPVARRMSDLGPYARLADAHRRNPDRIVGVGMAVVAIGAALILLLNL